MTRVEVPYGTGTLDCELPVAPHKLMPHYAEPHCSELELVARALDTPLGKPPLAELGRGKKRAVILIACRTRRTGSHIYVPLIVERLVKAGIPYEEITVITATGTHDNFRPQDAELLLGKELAGRVRFVGHDCDSPEKLEYVGTTSRGTEVFLNRTYLEADLRIVTGRVTCHYFAGFSGGRKGILPGVSARKTIRYNHSFAVIRNKDEVELNPHTVNGLLDGNPIHEDMLEAAKFAMPDFCLNTVLDPAHRIVAAFGGDMLEAHRAAVEIVREKDFISVDEPFDWLIVSSGGAPYDVNGIQAIKAPINTFAGVRKGGALILTAECPEGFPEWLLESTEIKSPEKLRAKIAAGQVVNGHNALWLEKTRSHAAVILVSALKADTIERLGFYPAKTLREAIRIAKDLTSAPQRIGIVLFGTTTVLESRSSK